MQYIPLETKRLLSKLNVSGKTDELICSLKQTIQTVKQRQCGYVTKFRNLPTESKQKNRSKDRLEMVRRNTSSKAWILAGLY